MTDITKEKAGTASEPKLKLVTFEKMELECYPDWVFRPNVPMIPFEMNFICINGGMGDYICWMTAIEWLAARAIWIRGTLIVPNYFMELAEYWLKPYPKWKFSSYKAITDVPEINNKPFRGPVELPRESLNATGAHLLTCGWVYFANKDKAPSLEWDRYPRFKQEDMDKVVAPDLFAASNLEAGKYAVITTGMTTNSRKTPKGAWNPIIDHVIARGLTPVFLGRSLMETGNPSNIHTTFDDNVNFHLGVDLRNKTSLMQAAAIMSRAAVVIGHDNGLLHLAGCTDTPIVFGYNLASPEHREPRRPVGKVFNVELTKQELACNNCQSNGNFVIGFNFRECYHGDLACMPMLFDNNGARWKKQIDLALNC